MNFSKEKDFDFVLNVPVFSITILLVILKITSLISWGWLWVLSPIWLPSVLIIGLFLVAFVLDLFSKKSWDKLK